MATSPVFPQQHLVVLAACEGLVMAGTVGRSLVLPGSVDLEQPLHLGWLTGTLFLAGMALSLFVLRSARVSVREQAGENVADERKQIFATSLAVLGLGFLCMLAGPGLLVRLVG